MCGPDITEYKGQQGRENSGGVTKAYEQSLIDPRKKYGTLLFCNLPIFFIDALIILRSRDANGELY